MDYLSLRDLGMLLSWASEAKTARYGGDFSEVEYDLRLRIVREIEARRLPFEGAPAAGQVKEGDPLDLEVRIPRHSQICSSCTC